MSSPKIKVPGPSAEEKALQAEQTAILRQQREILTAQTRQQELLAPILFKQVGINPIFDDKGEIVGFEEAEPGLREEIQQQSLEIQREVLELQRRELQTAEDLAPAERQLREQQLELSTRALERQERLGPLEEDVETRQLERTLAALKGELPVNPAILRELDERETVLREELRRQLGPGFETSTPGRNALDDFFRQKEEILEGSRRADIRDFEALSLARGAARRGDVNTGGTLPGSPFIAANLPSRFGDIFRSNDIAQLRSPSVGQLSSVASGFGSITAQLQADRQAQLQANIANATNRANTFGSIFKGVGNLFGSAAGVGAAKFLGVPATIAVCWIAEVLYGRNSNAFRAARYWIMFGWEGRMAKVCRWTYLRFGERIAGFLRKRPIFQIPARLVFDVAVRKGNGCFNG